MHAILISAFGGLMTWLVRVVVVKFLVFGLLLMVTTEFVSFLVEQLGENNPVDGVQGALSSLPSAALYFIGVLRLDVGIPLIFAAYGAAFAIRRLPIVG